MDADKKYGEKAWRQLHNIAASNIEQVLEAAPHKKQLYSHLPPIMKTMQIWRTRYAGHWWRSRDELIRDVLLWTPSHRWVKAGRAARTYMQQLCADTGCSLEDRPEAMDDREEWRKMVREIRANGSTWWWWYHTLFPTSDVLTVYTNRNVTASVCC